MPVLFEPSSLAYSTCLPTRLSTTSPGSRSAGGESSVTQKQCMLVVLNGFVSTEVNYGVIPMYWTSLAAKHHADAHSPSLTSENGELEG